MNTEPTPAPERDAPGPGARGWTWRALWPPMAVTGVLLTVLGIFMVKISRLNGGRLIYPVDDVYLHFAIAKNLLHHGIWGYSAPNGFSSGDSSLLYPLLLAAWTGLFGNVEAGGLALNVAALAGTMFYAAARLRLGGIVGGRSFLILLGTLFFAALPTVAATGMEHGCQILIDLVFVTLAADILAAPPVPGPSPRAVGLLALGVLVTAIRFEGMFLIGMVGLLLLFRRRWTLAVLLGVCAAAPLTLFGLYSVSKGWSVLPASVLLKGNTHLVLTPTGLLHYFGRSRQALAQNPQMVRLPLAMAGVLALELYRKRTLWSPLPIMLTITLGGCLLQVQFAALGWLYRYEAYLLVLALLALGAWVARELAGVDAAWWRGATLRARVWIALVVAGTLLMGVGLRKRTAGALQIVPIAAHNIFEQQYQMALFLHEFYEGKGVAANDIGLIDCLADIRLLDLMGLGDIDVVRAKRGGTYDNETVRKLMARHAVRVMVMYDRIADDYGGQLPECTRVGGWMIPDDVVCAYPTVGFYAPSDALIPEVVRALQAFAPRLPPYVAQEGLYRGGRPPHAQGFLGQTKADGGAVYRAAHSVAFALYPVDDGTVPAGGDAILRLDVRPADRNMGVDLFVNGEKLASKRFSAGGGWVPWSLPVRWRPGLNTLRVIGQADGDPSGPSREKSGGSPFSQNPLLFDLREPTWAAETPAAPTPAP